MIPGCSFLTKILLLLQIVEPFTSHYVFCAGGIEVKKVEGLPHPLVITEIGIASLPELLLVVICLG
jgi:hypothetical protein